MIRTNAWLVAFLLLGCLHIAEAQQRVYKIGELTARLHLPRSSDEFVRTLRELGYIEGKNIRYELRSAEGKPERFPALADELVRLKVDVLFATSTAEALNTGCDDHGISSPRYPHECFKKGASTFLTGWQ